MIAPARAKSSLASAHVPVKLVGLGEGADDLAPFDPEQFVDALLGDTV